MVKLAANIVGGILVALFALAASFYLEDWAHLHSPIVFKVMVSSGLGAALCYGSLFLKRETASTPPTAPVYGWPAEDPHRPRLVFDFTMQEGFTLRHVGGDAAIDIRIRHIQSVRHKPLRVVFEKISVLDSTDSFRVLPFRWDMGDRIQPEWTPVQLKNIFFKREDPHTAMIHYPVIVSFLWLSKRIEDHYTLTWDRERSRISVAPEITQPE